MNANVSYVKYGEPVNNSLYVETEGEYWVTYRLMCMDERGVQTLMKIAIDEDELLYEILQSATFDIASTYAARHSPKDLDYRRMLFRKHEDLMASLKPEWCAILRREHLQTLRNRPFDDNKGINVDYIVQLQSNGKTYDEAREEADARYPPLQRQGPEEY